MVSREELVQICQAFDRRGRGLGGGRISGEDLNQSQIITQLQEKRRPSPVPQDSPPKLVTLMEKCWNDQRFLRPEFKKVVREFQDMTPSQQTSRVGSAGLSAAE